MSRLSERSSAVDAQARRLNSYRPQQRCVGAKLTGGGGGGSMVALCPDSSERVRNAMQAAGYKTLSVTLD